MGEFGRRFAAESSRYILCAHKKIAPPERGYFERKQRGCLAVRILLAALLATLVLTALVRVALLLLAALAGLATLLLTALLATTLLLLILILVLIVLLGHMRFLFHARCVLYQRR
ncbi:MAG TPA: hypothetical protein VHD59_05835 [Pseudolabrys sp.]|nr:hypothetical protein [Pseudolabrys sp.]